MAVVSKVLYRGTASTTAGTTLYTTPSGTTAVVTNIVICNPTASSVTASMLIDSVDLLGSISISANSVFSFDLKQVIPATKILAGSASTTAVDFHISGVEIA